MDARDRGGRPVHVRRARAQVPVLKNTGFGAIGYDLLFLAVFTVVCMTAATWLFKRTL